MLMQNIEEQAEKPTVLSCAKICAHSVNLAVAVGSSIDSYYNFLKHTFL